MDKILDLSDGNFEGEDKTATWIVSGVRPGS
jgi:hypothetical protein